MLAAAQDQDGQRIQDLAKELATLEKTVESLFEDLERYMEEMESRKKLFDEQLTALEGCE